MSCQRGERAVGGFKSMAAHMGRMGYVQTVDLICAIPVGAAVVWGELHTREWRQGIGGQRVYICPVSLIKLDTPFEA